MASIGATCGISTALVNGRSRDPGRLTPTAAAGLRDISHTMDEIAATRDLWARVEHRMARLGLSLADIDRRVGKKDAVRNIKRAAEKGTKYDARGTRLSAIAVALRTTTDWLLYEAGPEEISEHEAAKATLQTVDLQTQATTSGKGRQEGAGRIRELDIHAGMGGGGVPAEEMRQIIGSETYGADAVRDYWSFPTHALRALGLDPQHADIVQGVGNSMEPDIRSGDWGVVDRRHRVPSPAGIYALWDGFNVVFKSLQIVPNTDPVRVRIISRNETYSTDELTIDEVAIIGRVVSLIRKL